MKQGSEPVSLVLLSDLRQVPLVRHIPLGRDRVVNCFSLLSRMSLTKNFEFNGR